MGLCKCLTKLPTDLIRPWMVGSGTILLVAGFVVKIFDLCIVL